MSGVVLGRKFQLVKEAVQGTEVRIATALWRGVVSYENQAAFEYPVEHIGYGAPINRRYTSKKQASVKIETTPATYEQLPYLFAMGIKNSVTGAADGGGTGLIYAYPMSVVLPHPSVVTTYSGQVGDDQQAEFISFLFAKTIHLVGKGGKDSDAVMMSADLIGRNVAPYSYSASTISFVVSGKHILDSANGLGSFVAGDKIYVTGGANTGLTFTVVTAAAGDLTVSEDVTVQATGTMHTLKRTYTPTVAVPAVEEILFGNGSLFIDAVGGTIGTTPITNSWLGFDLTIKTGWEARFTGKPAAGGLLFSHIVHTPQDYGFDLKITLQHDAYAVAEQAYAVAGTPRQLRMQFDSPTAYAAAGTKYANKALRIDLAGTWQTDPPLGEDDGNDTRTLTMRGGYDPTAVLFGNIEVSNLLAALT